jgi:hypothetical protein
MPLIRFGVEPSCEARLAVRSRVPAIPDGGGGREREKRRESLRGERESLLIMPHTGSFDYLSLCTCFALALHLLCIHGPVDFMSC